MSDTTLTLETGRTTGTRPSRRMRREDRIPGVVYGYETDPTSVVVGRRDLRRALTTDDGLNALLTLSIDGDSRLAVVRDLQRDPVRHEVVHVDFLAVDPNATISVDVAIHLVGESEKVNQADGGTIDQVLHLLHVNAKVTEIPREITVDVSDLDIGDAVRVGDLVLPGSTTTDLDPDDLVASATIVIVREPETEPAEGEELEGQELEGEAAEGEAVGGESEGGEAEGD